VSDFALTYDEVTIFFPGITPICTGCEEAFETGELAAHIRLGDTFMRLHRDCAEQLAVLLRQFIIATTPDEEGRVN